MNVLTCILSLASVLAAGDPVGLKCRSILPERMPRLEQPDPSKDIKVLKEKVVYKDPRSLEWVAWPGLETDGASIPRVFKHVIGGHWDERYVRGGIIHDQYYHCSDGRSRKAVDAMLREICACDGTSAGKARLIYLGVRVGGIFYWNGRTCTPAEKHQAEGLHLGTEMAATASRERTVSAGGTPGLGRSGSRSPSKLDGLEFPGALKRPSNPSLGEGGFQKDVDLTTLQASLRKHKLIQDVTLGTSDLRQIGWNLAPAAFERPDIKRILENRVSRRLAFQEVQEALKGESVPTFATLGVEHPIGGLPESIRNSIDWKTGDLLCITEDEFLARVESYCNEEWDVVSGLDMPSSPFGQLPSGNAGVPRRQGSMALDKKPKPDPRVP